jgi:hypothetical protein
MQKRHFLKLGMASAAALALVGGGLALVSPGLVAGKLSSAGQAVFAALGKAVLDGSLPKEPKALELALTGLLGRIDALAASLPAHAQAELSQLLAVLASGVGRQGLAGLSEDWAVASVAQTQAALQGMRTSSLAMRQQAYHALHDIVGGAYFSDASTWAQLGYPGPLKI